MNHALIISQEHLQQLLMFLGRFLHRLLSRGYSAKSGSTDGVTKVFSVWFFRIRGVDKKVVVIVPDVTCRNEQMAETESVRHGITPYRDTDEDVKASPGLRVRRDALLTSSSSSFRLL